MHAILVGNYGAGNLGDEALRSYFLSVYPQVTWTVISAHPSSGEVPRLPLGLRSFCATPWWRTLRAYARADAVVFGGGTLFTDVESLYACMLWFVHAYCARIFRKPLLFAFQGIGPFRTRLGRRLARAAMRHARMLSVRDMPSAARVAAWKLHTNVIQSFDPIYNQIIYQNIKRIQKLFIIIPRSNSCDALLAAARERGADGAQIMILSLAPDDPQEHEVCHSLAHAFLGAQVMPIHSLSALANAVGCASFVLTERYHGAVAALALQVPYATLAQGKGDKLDEISSLAVRYSSAELRALVARGEDALHSALR